MTKRRPVFSGRGYSLRVYILSDNLSLSFLFPVDKKPRSRILLPIDLTAARRERIRLLPTSRANRYRSILTDALQIFLESLYQISLAKCREIALLESWSRYINNITAYIRKFGKFFFSLLKRFQYFRFMWSNRILYNFSCLQRIYIR